MIVSGDWVVPVSGPPVAGAAVLVRDGVIAEVGPAAKLRARHPNEEVRECPGCAVLPGFVNAHTHLDYSAFQGFSPSRGFIRWIIRLTRARMKLDAQDLGASALWGAYECLRNGITSIADTSYGGSTVARAAAACGLRARVYLEVFGLDDARLAETMEKLESALRVAQAESAAPADGAHGAGAGSGPAGLDAGGVAGDPLAGGAHGRRAAGRPAAAAARLEWGVSPHAPYTVSQALYSEVARFARRSGLRMATHVAESKAEVRLLTRGSTFLALGYRLMGLLTGGRWRLPRVRPLRYVADAGALGADMLAVHAVQLDVADVELLAGSGSAVAHCPRSNERLGCGIAPVTAMRAAGITVALGTDSLASNDSLDMLAEMRAALTASRELAGQAGGSVLTPREVLQMATLDGAYALGWGDRVGSLEPGRDADVALVRLSRGLPPNSSEDDLYQAIMEGEVQMTIVGGTVAHDGGGVPGPIAAGVAAVRAKLGV